MLGPPAPGKTLLAKRVPSILPTPSGGESIETTRDGGSQAEHVKPPFDEYDRRKWGQVLTFNL